MYKVPVIIGQRRAVRFAFAGVTAGLLAGCADSGRVGGMFGDPLGNPFKTVSADPAQPHSNRDLAPPPYNPSRYSRVSSTPLAAPSSLPSRRVASYEAPAHESPRIAQTYAAPRTDRTASIASQGGHGNWSADGGMTVIAATGENANILGQRYNVPTDALLKANGLTSSSQVHAGTRLVIPVYNANAGGARNVAEREPTPKLTHDHKSRERLLARHEAPHAETTHVAKSDPVERGHWVKGPTPVATMVTPKPSSHASASPKLERRAAAVSRAQIKTVDVAKVTPTQAKPAKVAKVVEEVERPAKVAKVEAPSRKVAVDPTPTASLPTANEKIASNGNPEFRWPAHGRIIQGFKAGGNDGINIAVPEGTSVKAAESGVVAYAGSEIKGFGNLVLIRHPNGYVSAYANNGDIEVKRGEQVKRGQTIAKSGQSGNVASPQLHFELRKGSTPVDPTRYLAGL